jgi:hypothetical protein
MLRECTLILITGVLANGSHCRADRTCGRCSADSEIPEVFVRLRRHACLRRVFVRFMITRQKRLVFQVFRLGCVFTWGARFVRRLFAIFRQCGSAKRRKKCGSAKRSAHDKNSKKQAAEAQCPNFMGKWGAFPLWSGLLRQLESLVTEKNTSPANCAENQGREEICGYVRHIRSAFGTTVIAAAFIYSPGHTPRAAEKHTSTASNCTAHDKNVIGKRQVFITTRVRVREVAGRRRQIPCRIRCRKVSTRDRRFGEKNEQEREETRDKETSHRDKTRKLSLFVRV